MNARPLEQELRDYFEIEVRDREPSDQWWVNAVARAVEQKRRSRRFGFIPRTRLAWLLVPLAVLLIGGAVYAATSLVRELFERFAPQVEQGRLAQEMNLSQTVGGVTVRLERAYADANIVLIGYTVEGPEERYNAFANDLSTVDGQSLPAMLGIGFAPAREVLGWEPPELIAFLSAFQVPPLQGRPPSSMSLRLDIQVEEPSEPGETGNSIGQFVFEFTVPFRGGEVINVGQTAEAAGVTITLEQIVISPWATQAAFRFDPPYDELRNRPAFGATVQTLGGEPNRSGIGRMMKESSLDYYFGDFSGRSGEWTITIDQLVFPPRQGEIKRLAGPWVFRFQVP